MESTGQPGRMHASEQTAIELRARGKGSWLTAREDKVLAKGKGELSTWWVNIGHDGSKTATESITFALNDESVHKEPTILEEDDGRNTHKPSKGDECFTNIEV